MAESGGKVIRVFLSSTFVDFQEERSLLVKQVFPSLRRRARSRGVEIVDVDLRWGVTAEQTERGETLPLCLAEIDRCRPYFISLLGERYGWVPPAVYYKPELLERQPWLREQMGGASVTELEILHGVLRNPEMAGHACFYLRNPAYAQAQSEPGWVAENPLECQRLVSLKEEVRRSGFPVIEGLANPQAIAERIEADLWELIERTFPEQEPPDALEKEGRRHADYRRARTGLYLGGETAITQLEGWIAAGEQRILITGESGAGKSALIANWLEAHQRSAPQDLVHAHHLGCTNDASAVRPLLGRLIETASQLLIQEQQISEPLKVPQDWWELVFKVGEVFALISCWIQRHGCRWILVLDGLDRLDQDDQQALPWIPTKLPPGIHIVASALDCPARSILHERAYLTLEIGPLGQGEQQQLIERYLGRYTKQLESGLQQKILAHPLAGSPLFLKVLLEELRQCAGFDTLADQLEFYLFAESIDGLYGKVLERLEHDGHGEATRQALTALWASRAGLSETELLAITGLAPVQWAPVDLALEEAFGRNGERLVFGHEFVRQAVERRYLPGRAEQQEAHGALAEWFEGREGWDERTSEEWPWQMQQAGRLEELREMLKDINFLMIVASHCTNQEVLNYWQVARVEGDVELDELIAEEIQIEIEENQNTPEELIDIYDSLAALLDKAGLYRDPLLRLRTLAIKIKESSEGWDEEELLTSQLRLADAYRSLARLCQVKGDFEQAEMLYLRTLNTTERLLGREHASTLSNMNNLATLYADKGDYEQAEVLFLGAMEAMERVIGREHPSTLKTVNNLAGLYQDKGDYGRAELFYIRALGAMERMLGFTNESTLSAASNLAGLYREQGYYEQAEMLYLRTLAAIERLLGREHPNTITIVGNLARLYLEKGDYEQAGVLYERKLVSRERLAGCGDSDTHVTLHNLAETLTNQKRHAEAIPLRRRALAWSQQQNGDRDPSTLLSINKLAIDLRENGELEESETLFRELIEGRHQASAPSDFQNGRALGGLAKTLEASGKLDEALIYAQKCLDHRMEHQGLDDFYTNRNRLDLARVLHKLGQFAEASTQLDTLLASLSTVEWPDESDQQLQEEAKELCKAITGMN
jgi:tetratricopeptide (TPR) repeat protein